MHYKLNDMVETRGLWSGGRVVHIPKENIIIKENNIENNDIF